MHNPNDLKVDSVNIVEATSMRYNVDSVNNTVPVPSWTTS